MRKIVFCIVIPLLFASVIWAYDPYSVQLSEEEIRLYHLVMDYRAERGLPKIPLSPALTYVAQTHAKDCYEHFKEFPEGCNMHSWSSNGTWTRCDYYPDHRNASCMWSKPRELTTYQDNGYEISHFYNPPTSGNCTAEGALAGWKQSSGHNSVIINLGIWSDSNWQAIGVAIYKGYACIWFGEEKDEYRFDI